MGKNIIINLDRERDTKPVPNPFSPVPERGPRRKRISKHVFIVKDQLFYDIDAQTALVARARRQDPDNSDTIATSEEDGYRPLFHRWIEKYASNVRSRLAAYILVPVRTATMNDLKYWSEMDIELSMSLSWDDTEYDNLVDAIHDYIVNGVLTEYFKLTLTSKDPLTVDKENLMDESWLKIKQYVNTVKPASVQKPMSPF